jgi:hypothetical protein
LRFPCRTFGIFGACSTAPLLVGYSGETLVEPFRGTLEFFTKPMLWLSKSTRTPSFGNRFMTTCGFNIRNGSSQMASRLFVIFTKRVS